MNPVLFFVAGTLAWFLHTTFAHLSVVPRQIPWAGRNGFSLLYLVSQIKAILNTPSIANEAYHKYNKNGLICAIPLPFSRPEILLPRSFIRWMISQADGVMSPTPVQYEAVGVKYAFVNPSVDGDMAFHRVIRANLTKELPRLIPEIMEEIALRIDENFGVEGEWQEVSSNNLVRKVIGRVSSRVFLGSPLCRDEKLLDDMTSFSTFVFPTAVLLRFFPPFMHPLCSYITHFFNRVYKRRSMKILGPYIQEQIEIHERDMNGQSKMPQRNDLLTWLVADAVQRNESRDGLVDRIVCRLLIAVFGAMETTTITLSHTLFDICATDPSMRAWENLAEEGHRLFSQPLDLARINGLIRADSALKETLRLRTAIKALATEVRSPDGITLEGFDVRIPKGARLSVSSWGIHRDEAIYGPDPGTYNPFRFSRPCERKVDENAAVSECTTSDGKGKPSLMVSATENHLSFGLGRHACPGRYFAALEMKLCLAYLAVNYDLKLTDAGRPDLVCIGHFLFPPLTGKLMVRRKSPLPAKSLV